MQPMRCNWYILWRKPTRIILLKLEVNAAVYLRQPICTLWFAINICEFQMTDFASLWWEWNNYHINHHCAHVTLFLDDSLHAEFFNRHIKHVFPIYIIPLHWHDTGSWNPSSCKTMTYLVYTVNIMAADGLVTQAARASETMILT